MFGYFMNDMFRVIQISVFDPLLLAEHDKIFWAPLISNVLRLLTDTHPKSTDNSDSTENISNFKCFKNNFEDIFQIF